VKRGGPIQRKTPMRRTAMRKKPGKKRAMGKPDARWRSDEYLAWVRTLPCVISGQPADEAHHIIGVGGYSGVGLTAPDWAAMPVTREAHREIHMNPELWPEQWRWIAQTLGAAVQAGVLSTGDI
jgi:hypothetical protein